MTATLFADACLVARRTTWRRLQRVLVTIRGVAGEAPLPWFGALDCAVPIRAHVWKQSRAAELPVVAIMPASDDRPSGQQEQHSRDCRDNVEDDSSAHPYILLFRTRMESGVTGQVPDLPPAIAADEIPPQFS